MVSTSSEPTADAARPVRRVVVVGAGIGGLMSALALQARGIEATVLERDPAPPRGVAPPDSMTWLRRGVPQALHPHFFMGRLRLLIEARYPELLASLAAAGAGEGRFEDYIHPAGRARHRARPDDARLRSINCRRTTFEMTVRQAVERLSGVRLIDGVRVERLVTHRSFADYPVAVLGVETDGSGALARIEADAVIDASGRSSKLADQLAAAGARIETDQRDSGIWYFTRHYRLKPGGTYPESWGVPGAQFQDFIVGALPADNGAFTVTFQIYREDKAIAKALRDPDHFQAMCRAVGRIAPWVDPDTAEPTSEVYGFGQMDSFWRRTVIDGEPRVLGYFCVGDSGVRSNPKFGRGCTWTAVAAHHLADLLAAALTPAERIRRYEALLADEFRHDWETMRGIDRSTEAAFEVGSGRRAATLKERLASRFSALLDRAMLTEPAVFREVWAGYHGLQGMSDWTRKPAVWLGLARATLARPPAALARLATRPTRVELATSNPPRDTPS